MRRFSTEIVKIWTQEQMQERFSLYIF